jgi:TolB-like protein/Tfp pilus assembly protein PilF
VAVLPFANGTADPNTEYLSDGFADSLIGSLSRLPNLTVRPHSSVFRYKSKDPDLQKVASELRVGAVVSGRVMRRGDSLLISAELTDTRSNRSLWSGQYESRPSDILVVQRELTGEIAARLTGHLTAEQKSKITEPETNDPEVYQLYLKGRYYWEKRTPESLSRAKQYYEQAIQKDPRYALAYVGLAEYFLALPDYTNTSVREAYASVKFNAVRALEIDESQAQAHALLATTYDNDWNSAAAAREYERALELNPRDARIHVLYGTYFQFHGNQEQAFRHFRRALELNPVDLNASENLAYSYYYSREYSQAIEQVKNILQLDPSYAAAHATLSGIYRFMGKYDLWLEEWEKSAELNNDAEELRLIRKVRMEYRNSGFRTAIKRLIALRKEQANRMYVDPTVIANDYATLADKEQAFVWLERAYGESSMALLWAIKTDPNFDFLRSDARYRDLLRRMDLQ